MSPTSSGRNFRWALALGVVCLGLSSLSGAGVARADAPAALKAERARLRLSVSDISDVVVTDRYVDRDTGVTHLYLRQRHRGLDVIDGTMTLTLARDGSVASAGDRFVRGLERKAGGVTPRHTGAEARVAAGRSLRAGRLAGGAPKPRLVYAKAPSGELRLAWNSLVESADGEHLWDAAVDAHDLRLLSAVDWVADAGAYRVFAPPLASPLEGPRTLVSDPGDLLASPHGWHDTDGSPGPESTLTIGNNVHAATDVDDDNVPDPGSEPDGGTGLLFDFPLDLTQEPSAYASADVTNLFFWNNHVHDVAYRYGFTEEAGNFQENNYGRGGDGADAVQADSQDGAGLNNASFQTAPDGEQPRMQMFPWRDFGNAPPLPDRSGSLDADIVVHEYTHGISSRLTGGPSNVSCLGDGESGGMGEGWSDFVALVLTAKATDTATTPRTIASYSTFDPGGFRPSPYSTDLAVDDATYDSIAQDGEPHSVGWVWATMLWDLHWKLGGGDTASQLVFDAMKIQPCGPGFVDARDAILTADQLRNGGQNACAIWQAFARRGLGLGADQGSPDDSQDGTESFVACGPSVVSQGITVTERGDGDGVEPGEAIAVTGSFENLGLVDADVDSLSLTMDGAGFSFFRPVTAFPDLPGRATGQNAEPLLAKIPPDAQCGSNLTATLTLAGSHGTTQAPVLVELAGAAPSSSASSADIPKAIPDGDPQGVESTLSVAGLPAPLHDVDVSLASISHPYTGDLEIALTSPAGTKVILTEATLLEGTDFNGTTFDDEATESILHAFAPFTGAFKPAQNLSAFDGENGNGTWTLNVADAYEPDTGTLNAWGLALTPLLCNAAPTPPTLGFTATPASPQIGQAVEFRSTASDNGPIERQRWDLDNDGAFDDGTGTTAAWTSSTAGPHDVRLEVVDDRLDTYVHTKTITAGYRFVGFLSPLPKSTTKAGSVIPVKFALADGNGIRISDAQGQAIAAACDAKITFTGGTPTPNCFSYDASADAFQFNLSTPKTLTGNQTITATIKKGTAVLNASSVSITIKR